MSESIESMRRFGVGVVDLPTGKLKPDPDNPNKIGQDIMNALRRDITERGFFQPVLVRPMKGGYRIIDGEHRWRILSEAKAKTVPCVIDDALDDDAKVRMITMNRLQGRPDPVKLADLLVELVGRLDEDELRERLAVDEEEWVDLTAPTQFDEGVEGVLAAALDEEGLAAPEVLRWRLGPRQAQQVEERLKELTEDGTSRADALIAILEAA